MLRRHLLASLPAALALSSASARAERGSVQEIDAPAGPASVVSPEEEYGRVVQSVNLAMADRIWMMPTPAALSANPARGQHALREWVQESQSVLAAQLVTLEEVAAPPRTPDRTRAAAMASQHEALNRMAIGFGLMLREFEYFAEVPSETLTREHDWFADAFYDARGLALNVQKDLAFAQADLAADPFVAACLRVLAHSTNIQLELSIMAHNGAHGVEQVASPMGRRMVEDSNAMRAAIAVAYARLPLAGENAEAWAECLAHEARIAEESLAFAIALRDKGGWRMGSAQAHLEVVMELYRSRPSRTTSFAQKFTL